MLDLSELLQGFPEVVVESDWAMDPEAAVPELDDSATAADVDGVPHERPPVTMAIGYQICE